MSDLQVDGLGGAFIFSHDPERLARWYERAFGISFEHAGEGGAFYTIFWAADVENPSRRLDTTFAIMRRRPAGEPHETPEGAGAGRPSGPEEPDATREGPGTGRAPDGNEAPSMYGDQPYMVNLRTRDLDALVRRLESQKIRILKREDHDYGRFAWVRDADGNRVELYEPRRS